MTIPSNNTATAQQPSVPPLSKKPESIKPHSLPAQQLNEKPQGKPPADSHDENTTEADLVLNRDLNSTNDI